jgi:hypothetical protein
VNTGKYAVLASRAAASAFVNMEYSVATVNHAVEQVFVSTEDIAASANHVEVRVSVSTEDTAAYASHAAVGIFVSTDSIAIYAYRAVELVSASTGKYAAYANHVVEGVSVSTGYGARCVCLVEAAIYASTENDATDALDAAQTRCTGYISEKRQEKKECSSYPLKNLTSSSAATAISVARFTSP